MGSNLLTSIEKLEKMKEYIDELKMIYKDMEYSKYKKDNIKKYAIERLVQLIVDLALDINNIILSYLKKPTAIDYYSSFIDIGEEDVIPVEFAIGIAPSAGLRNRLVHQYETIDDEIVYASIPEMIRYYEEYMKHIEKYVK